MTRPAISLCERALANLLPMAELVSWWNQRMCNSPAPLAEKMTLFWHGHFATSAEKVNSYRMWLQNETLRMYALGNFGTLVKAISCDPAMLTWLDLAASQKEHPNENFARELMELFTLGEGHYTENDTVRSCSVLFTIKKWAISSHSTAVCRP
jgi:uncharacterized protein (DUF1800 family)